MKGIAAFSERVASGDTIWPARIFLCLAVLLSYASVLPNEFVVDDRFLIAQNDFLKHWSGLPKLMTSVSFAGSGVTEGFYRPVQMLIYFLIYQAFGPSAVAFHALNIALQALNACLLHHFGIKAGFRKGAAFAAALLWAVHPLHTTDVAYAASTAELLWSSFCLLGLIALLPDFTPQKIWQAMIFFILALGCKESAVVFPALATATLFFASNERARLSTYLKTWPLWLLAACYVVFWLSFIHISGYSLDRSRDPQWFQYYTSNFPHRVLTSLATLPVYARLIVWPAELYIERIFPVFPTLLAWPPAIGAVMGGLSLWQIIRGKELALSFGLLWFAIALSPYTGIVFPIDAIISEGWMYMPTMGLFLGAAQTAAVFLEKRQNASRVFVMVVAVSLAVTTFFQNEAWRNTETLYQNVMRNGGPGYRLCGNVGLFYMKQGKFDKAIEKFHCALAHQDRNPDIQRIAAIHLQLAMAWLQVRLNESEDGGSQSDVVSALPSCRHIPDTISELGKALQYNPDSDWAHIVLVDIYHYQGDNQMADFHLKQAESISRKQWKY